uniref:Fructose facilitator n=3 Tax=Starmerella magnoliae TaxID=5490 RepID=A0A0P0IQN7_9ASCO|nr:fructose facilitator [Starmerella magnoliae]
MVKLGASADLDWSHLDKPQGRVAGGKYVENVDEAGTAEEDRRPLQKVECDMPMTLTDSVMKDGKEWVVLEFAENDPEDPFNWNIYLKAFLTALLCGMTLFIGLATTAYSSGISRMVSDLHRSNEIGQLGLFTFNMTCAIAPLFLAPFCELVGRRIIYVGGYALFGVCFVGLALGKNMATIIVLRALLGLFGCIGTILVGGTFDDMFRPEQRAIPMALFAYVAILGTVGAPIYAGFVDQAIGWRWLEGIQGLSNVPLLVLCVFGLRETRGSVYLHKRAKALRKDTGDERWVAKEELESPGLKEMLYNSSVKSVLMLVTEPVVFFFGLWIAFAWFITFLFLSVIGITFGEKKHWGEGVAGLPYIALVIGVTLAFAANFLQIHKYDSMRRAANHPIQPEHRLYGAMMGAVFLPIGLFIYSFTQYSFVHWIGPCIGLGCISFGIFFIFESCYSFTSDCYGPSASSAIAGQGFMRNTLGAVSPLFGAQFFHNVGSQYAGLILSLIASVLTALPFVLYKFGPEIRAKSKRAITYDTDDNNNKDDASQSNEKEQTSDSHNVESREDSTIDGDSKKNVEIF